MAVLQRIRDLFISLSDEPEIIIPAAESTYDIKPLTINQLKEVWKLNQRCFRNGENYPRHTLSYLLSEPNNLSYRVVTENNELVGFIFITVAPEGTGHITTIGVAPEHRRRGLARKMMVFVEDALQKRDVNTICLEVRVSNTPAQTLYQELGYAIVQRLGSYYSNGEDGFLMVKSLF